MIEQQPPDRKWFWRGAMVFVGVAMLCISLLGVFTKDLTGGVAAAGIGLAWLIGSKLI